MKLLLLLLTLHAHADEATCLKTAANCSDVDLDSSGAEAAFRRGCEANDAYSCSRLGQFYEVKKNDKAKAVEFYDRGCKGKDAFGCDQAKDLHLSLCYLEAKKKYCEGYPATGEYRTLLFLRDLDPKYADAFRGHNFDNAWELKQTGVLFERRVKEKNKKLLRALEAEKKNGHHDGADAEGLSYHIQCIKKKCPEYEFGEL